jgi:hypothetical protein
MKLQEFCDRLIRRAPAEAAFECDPKIHWRELSGRRNTPRRAFEIVSKMNQAQIRLGLRL